ncbi:MAG: hypothetical protein R8N50_00465 [Alphaproteobacteria bacterium]|nr:hypothetical protein [Alphaproteobacteria bacterium]
MKFVASFLFNCSAFLLVAVATGGARGAYYQPAQQGYVQQGYAQQGYVQQPYAQRVLANTYTNQGAVYNQNQYANDRYANSRTGMVQTQQVQQRQQTSTKVQPANTATQQSGLSLGIGVNKQVASWGFEMGVAGSKLHYDNVDWLVLDVAGKYGFNFGSLGVQLDAGLQYGMQTGETTMVDDDITNGGYLYGVHYYDDLMGIKNGHAMSIGASKDGSMFGYNVGLGFADMFKIGALKVTPSVGWRYLKYKLETSNNKGAVVVNADYDGSCVTLEDGSVQCWPLIAAFDSVLNYASPVYPGYSYFDANGNQLEDVDGDGYLDGDAYYVAIQLPSGYDFVEAEGTFYFEQPDVSHSYEVEWAGPYVGLGMRYDINQYNWVDANFEFGLPAYTATGDQPYRIDWQHPKSIQDKGGIGSGIHFGMGADWRTMLTDSIALSVGVTYDYYKVSDADATTYLNPEYWEPEYDLLFDAWWTVLNDEFGYSFSAADIEYYMLNGITATDGIVDASGNAVVLSPEYVAQVRANGWEDTTDGEVESFYKSLGIRIGINARF